MRLYTIFPFLLLLIAPALFSQEQALKFYSLTTKDGLSSNEVNCVFKDSKGFLWIGTNKGLNKYDGKHFSVYKNNPANSSTISGNQVFAIAEDAQNQLWITTNRGLNRFEPSTETFAKIALSQNSTAFGLESGLSLLLLDHNGHLWVSNERKLNCIDVLTAKPILLQGIDIANDIAKNITLSCIYEDKLGHLLLGFWDGRLLQLDPDRKHLRTIISRQANKPALFIARCMYEDTSKKIWIGTSENGLWTFDANRQQLSQPTTIFGTTEITSLIPVGTTQLCVGQGHSIKQINVYTNKLTSAYSHNSLDPTSFTAGYTVAGYKDNEGIIWYSTAKNAVCYSDAKRDRFAPFYHAIGTATADKYYVRAFAVDAQGDKWLGTYGNGLLHFDAARNKYTAYTQEKDGLSSNIITTICPLKSGLFLLGTPNGINLFQPKLRKLIPRNQYGYFGKSILLSSYIFHVLEHSNGNLWVAAGSGLELIQGEKHIHFDQFGLGKLEIRHLLEDKNGAVWIATAYGLYRYEAQLHSFVRYFNDPKNTNSLSDSDIQCLFTDSDGVLWVGTANGLNVYDAKNNSFKPYPLPAVMGDLSVYRILQDENRFYWLLTTNGLLKFKGSVVRQYDQSDGLLVNPDFMSKDAGGRIYVGGAHTGFYAFKPQQIKDNILAPAVYITGLSIFNQPVVPEPLNKNAILQQHISYTREIKLSYDQTSLEFQVAALNYTFPEKNRFAYQLLASNKEWVMLDAGKSSIVLTHLEPGNYTLNVKGSNNDGVWNAKVTSLKIEVLPPFWRSVWAYFVYFLMMVFVFVYSRIVILSRFSEKSKSELERMKLRFFSNVSHELRTPLTLISGPLSQLIYEVKQGAFTKEKLLEHFMLMQRNTDRLMHLTNQLLDLQKTETGMLKLQLSVGDVKGFVQTLYAAFVPKAQEMNVQYLFIHDDEKIDTLFDPDKLEKIIVNLLSNAFKFCKTTVELKLTVQNNHLVIVVQDDGIGISQEYIHKIFDNFYQIDNSTTRKTQGTGIGLALTRELVLLHKGTIQVESEPEKGTAFRVELPIVLNANVSKPIPDEVALTTDNCQLSTDEFAESTDNSQLSTADSPLVLIVEDNPDLRLFMRSVLADRYRMVEAENGKVGVELALELMPDLIISDVMMPVMDGMELCDTLKNDERTSHIPIILLTALSATKSKLKGLMTGADDYVTKPFDAQLLMARIENLIALRRKLQLKFQQLPQLPLAEVTTNAADEKLLKRAVELVEKGIENQDFNIQQFIEGMNMSRAGLYVKIKALTGLSVSDFINSVRLRRASQLLLSNEFTIAEIGYKVGFQNRSQLNRAFKEHFLMTPTEFIQKNKK